ncbi:partial Cadmium, zinc and cobalt-transporting ATPase, partial [Anaerolineae bacterium]
EHLMPLHKFTHLLIVSGDRESEARYLTGRVGNTEVFSQKTPEERVAIVEGETAKARTLYVGDGINDAPALMSATVATLTLRTLREGRIRLAMSRYRGSRVG